MKQDINELILIVREIEITQKFDDVIRLLRVYEELDSRIDIERL
jgi:hypothetical protein